LEILESGKWQTYQISVGCLSKLELMLKRAHIQEMHSII